LPFARSFVTETRKELEKQALKYRELARQLADPVSSERIISRAIELEAEAKNR
jgi:hypothetical protein